MTQSLPSHCEIKSRPFRMGYLLFAVFVWFLCMVSLSYAQSPISTSGMNTQVSAPIPVFGGTQYNITGGTRPSGGPNLFHSFGNFNVPANNIANFLNETALPTSNILGRVTGGNVSNILGAIQTTGFGSANLFLMNPAGFLFGPNATVNVGGMVAFTTADYLRIGGNGTFYADPAQTSVLTSAPVAAFGFLGPNPGAITVQGSQLSVTPGQSLSLVGGNITIQAGALDDGTVQPAKLSVAGGQINLASVASPGEILTGTLAQAPNINGQSFGNLGTIEVAEQSVIDVSGDGGGTVLIRGGQFLLDNSTIFANVTGPGSITNRTERVGSGIDIVVSQDAVIQNAAVIETNVSGNATAGVQYRGIHVNADNIEIIGSQDFENFPFTGIRSNIAEGSTGGNSGNITLEGNTLLVQDLGTFSTILESMTEGAGDSGDIVLKGSTNIHFDGAIVQTASLATAGNAGNISVDSANGDISLTNFSSLQSFTEFGSGKGGDIALVAKEMVAMDSPFISTGSFEGTGDSGNISITSVQGDISMTNGPFVNSQSGFSSGTVGNIALSAPVGDILIAGGNEPGTAGAVFTASRPTEGGEQPLPGSGQITITSNNLTILNAGIQIDNFSLVEPGKITITLSEKLSVAGTSLNFGGTTFTSNISTRSRNSARSADVNITARDISITDNAFISSETFQAGEGGTVNVRTQNLQLTDGGQLRSGSVVGITGFGPVPEFTNPSGPGGTINIQGHSRPTASVLIDGVESGIFTNSHGTGTGGDTNILAQSVTIQNGGVISAQANGSGSGGQINISTDNLQLTNGGQLTSGSVIGINPFTRQPLPPPSGPAGGIIIQGLTDRTGSVMIDGVQSGIFTNTAGTGGGGNISVDSNTVMLQNGGTLSAATSGTALSATGGTITVNAENVALNSQAAITADTNGIAPAGVVDINTGTLAINSGGQIRSSSGAETQQLRTLALSPAVAPLTGGTITIQGRTGTGSQADSVTIDGVGSGIFTESTGTRRGGDINLLTSQSVTMTNGSSISSSSTGTGNAGNININAGNQFTMTNSTVTTEANQASGGAIKITTTPAGTVQMTNSTISASVLDGTGGGGSVDIDPQFVILQNSQITADAESGPGGNIFITTNLLLQDPTSRISASSQFGQQGTVTIQSPASPASGKLVPLGQKPLIATALVSQRCAALAGGNASSFTVAGRDSLPAEPGGWVSSPLALSMAESNEGPATETAFSSFSERAGGSPLLSLRKISPPGFLTQSFAVDSSDGCAS
jgi:filamentous hemagglutinin family protein